MPPTDTHVSGFKHALWYVLAAGWSSLVARRAHNPKVAGSNPAPAMHVRSASAPSPGVEALCFVPGVLLPAFRGPLDLQEANDSGYCTLRCGRASLSTCI